MVADVVGAIGILPGSHSTLWSWHSGVAGAHHSQQEAEVSGKSAAWGQGRPSASSTYLVSDFHCKP